MIAIITILILLLLTAGIFYTKLPKFGKLPDEKIMEKIMASPNYKDGSFRNLTPTPDLAEGVTYYDILKDFFFGEKQRLKPIDSIPFIKTDILNLAADKDILIWFGHSSYYIQTNGKTILVDPVFSGNASPLPATMKSFPGTDEYTANDFPFIDYLFITHDHWDHLDYETILQIKSKTGKIICGLGVAVHLRHWGVDAEIIETDWYDNNELDEGFSVITTPARHFSGRTFKRNQSLWASYILKTPSYKLFIGGDSGYDNHFAEIGKKHGPFDLAILENGQYNWKWKYIHTSPEETLQAAADLQAKKLLPVHSSKFALALHSWDEPLKRVTTPNNIYKGNVITPIIGEPVFLQDSSQTFIKWWEKLN